MVGERFGEVSPEQDLRANLTPWVLKKETSDESSFSDWGEIVKGKQFYEEDFQLFLDAIREKRTPRDIRQRVIDGTISFHELLRTPTLSILDYLFQLRGLEEGEVIKTYVTEEHLLHVGWPGDVKGEIRTIKRQYFRNKDDKKQIKDDEARKLCFLFKLKYDEANDFLCRCLFMEKLNLLDRHDIIIGWCLENGKPWTDVNRIMYRYEKEEECSLASREKQEEQVKQKNIGTELAYANAEIKIKQPDEDKLLQLLFSEKLRLYGLSRGRKKQVKTVVHSLAWEVFYDDFSLKAPELFRRIVNDGKEYDSQKIVSAIRAQELPVSLLCEMWKRYFVGVSYSIKGKRDSFGKQQKFNIQDLIISLSDQESFCWPHNKSGNNENLPVHIHHDDRVNIFKGIDFSRDRGKGQRTVDKLYDDDRQMERRTFLLLLFLAYCLQIEHGFNGYAYIEKDIQREYLQHEKKRNQVLDGFWKLSSEKLEICRYNSLSARYPFDQLLITALLRGNPTPLAFLSDFIQAMDQDERDFSEKTKRGKE